MGNGGLRSVPPSSSLPLLPPHSSPCSSPGPLQGLQGNTRPSGVSAGAAGASLPGLCLEPLLPSCRSPLGARRAVSPPVSLSPGCRAALCPSLPRLSPRRPPGAEGLSCALRWGRWSRLEPAVSGAGQPRPLPAGAHPAEPSLLPALAPSTGCNLYGLGYSGGK